MSEDWRPKTPMRYCETTFESLEENLALDEALLMQADADDGGGFSVLRIWEPRNFAVVLGATRRLREEVLVENCAADGVPIMRRSSGGGTVVVGPGTINAAVVLRDDEAPGLGAVDRAQQFVLGRFAAALQGAVDSRIEVLGLGDLAVDSRKFAGSAQRRLKRWFLVHVSLLYDFELARIPRYIGRPAREPAYRRGRSHEDFLMNLGAERKIVLDSLRRAWIDPTRNAQVVAAPGDLVETLVREKYSNRAWIERF